MNANSPESNDAHAEILTTLVTILSNVGGVDQDDITVESRLNDDLAISSLNLIETVVQVEDTFGVRIEEGDVQGFYTVGDIISFIEANRLGATK